MNIIDFKYTKKDGSVSKRVLSPTKVPCTMYEGTDLSEISIEDQILYVQELGRLKDEFAAKIMELNSKYDVNNKYRRFDPKLMTEVIEEHV